MKHYKITLTVECDNVAEGLDVLSDRVDALYGQAASSGYASDLTTWRIEELDPPALGETTARLERSAKESL